MLVEIFFFLLCVSSSIGVETECSAVWLTVFSVREDDSDSPVYKLQVNWNFTCPNDVKLPNIIKVFDTDPTQDSLLKPRLTLNIKDYANNYCRSDIIARTSPLPGGWHITGGPPLVGPHCFDHFAALYKENNIVVTSCLQIQPTWMQDYGRELGTSPIAALIIPGTQNSGSFRTGHELENIVDPFLVSQNCDVWTQLVYGIRYLDMRVGYYKGDGFWVNHGIFSMNLLIPILMDVKKFLRLATGEVVIMDFHGFTEGFADGEAHYRLIQILHETFGQLLVEFTHDSNNLGPTLNDMVHSGKRLIICYSDSDIVSQREWVWPPLTKTCVDQQTSNGLFAFIDNTEERNSSQQQNSNPLWAVLAYPGFIRTIIEPCAELRVIADTVNRNLTSGFLQGQWKETNIIVSDFFQANNLIDIAIQSNIKKNENKPQLLSNDSMKETNGSIKLSGLQHMQCGKVWLTVSSLRNPERVGDKFIGTNLEINWELNCPSGIKRPNRIKVYISDPSLNPMGEPVFTIDPNRYHNEYVRTNITVRMDSVLPGGWNTGNNVVRGSHCLHYYAALYYYDKVHSIACLRIQPTWMDDHRSTLNILRIGDLMIPGTHHSGSYKLHYDSSTSDFENYVLTQDRDIWMQLVHGIRYFDLKVEFYYERNVNITPDSTSLPIEGFSVNHRTMLRIVIEDVRRFLTVSTGEIVILDFRRFVEGFDIPAVHHSLISILLLKFRQFIFEYDSDTNSLGPTLNDIWETGKRLIICYNDTKMLEEYNWLWPSVQYASEVRYEPYQLIHYLNDGRKGSLKPQYSENPLWAILAALTPMPMDMFNKPGGGYRVMANSVNRELSVIFQDKLCQETNIVATDFFLGNSLIDISIMCNKLKAFTAALQTNISSVDI